MWLLPVLALALPAAAGAQSLGAYRWQLRPFCNVVTLLVTQQGAQYTLDGTDDQCGSSAKAAVRGMAFLNPGGGIGFGLTIVTVPGGNPVHVEAAIVITTLSGSWKDSLGHSGDFVFTPGAGEPGPPRLVSGPRAGFAPFIDVVALSSAPTVVRSIAAEIRTPGTLLVSASGYFALRSTGQDLAACSITTLDVVFTDVETRADDFGAVASQAFIPMAATRGFALGPRTAPFVVNLVCERRAGAVEIRNVTMTALFVPLSP
jgi:hypothetical protein